MLYLLAFRALKQNVDRRRDVLQRQEFHNAVFNRDQVGFGLDLPIHFITYNKQKIVTWQPKKSDFGLFEH